MRAKALFFYVNILVNTSGLLQCCHRIEMEKNYA